jgi:hypothetical protein
MKEIDLISQSKALQGSSKTPRGFIFMHGCRVLTEARQRPAGPDAFIEN